MPTSRIEEFERFQIHEDDILISLTGDVGRVGRFPEELLPALLNQRVGRFQGVDEARVNLDFLFQLLNSDWFEKQVIASAEGAAQMNSSTKKIKAIEIPLPPLSAQMKLAEELGEFESLARTLERQCESQLESLEELRQSILEQAFKGKLTEPVAA